MENETANPLWQPIERNERRVFGVLIEKAKTTPDSYPLSLNALRNGCNQKSNRFPQMELDEGHLDDAIDGLRKLKAVSIIQGDSRVEKYRHLAYEWLGVDKYELAVMAELLLRGAQTLGELRGRAARMEPIAGMTELRPVLASLIAKNLVIYLTPPGRGAIVTHNLYQPQELEKVRRENGNGEVIEVSSEMLEADESQRAEEGTTTQSQTAPGSGTTRLADSASESDLASLREELRTIRAEMSLLATSTSEEIASLRSDLEDLQRQLGG